jgi:L-ascorbate metabolism protein UlaG (beta-lactamase superfamily)
MPAALAKKSSTYVEENDLGTSTFNQRPSGASVMVRWNGTAFQEIKLPNGKSIIIDPYYKNVKNQYVLHPEKTAADIVSSADYTIISHTHFDHVTDIPDLLAKNPDMITVMPAESIPTTSYTLGLDPANMNMVPVDNNDVLEFPDFTLEVIRGKHTQVGSGGPLKTYSKHTDPFNDMQFMYGTNEFFNYIITTKEGFKILVHGGQVATDFRQHKYYGLQPDLMFYQIAKVNIGDGMHIGDMNNPKGKVLGDFMGKVNPKVAIPTHHEKYDWNLIEKVSKEVVATASERGASTDVFAPKTHEWYRYTKDRGGKVTITVVK